MTHSTHKTVIHVFLSGYLCDALKTETGYSVSVSSYLCDLYDHSLFMQKKSFF